MGQVATVVAGNRHEHEQHDNVDDRNEHVHEDGTTHSHDEGAESKRPGFLARLFGAR